MNEDEIQSLVTVETILGYLKDAVEKRESLPPTIWIEAAQKLNVLLGDESDKLFDLQQKLAEDKVHMLEAQDKLNVSEVKVRIEATPLYTEIQKQSAKIKRIEEFIRIAKLQARMKSTEMRGY